METVLLVILLLVTIAMVAVILLQRSEGGALGIGGSANAMFSARGAGNALTRATSVLAALFFVLAIILTMLAVRGEKPGSVFDRIGNQNAPAQQAPATPVLPTLPKAPATPAIPQPPAGGQ